jgi:hypothetical protein
LRIQSESFERFSVPNSLAQVADSLRYASQMSVLLAKALKAIGCDEPMLWLIQKVCISSKL